MSSITHCNSLQEAVNCLKEEGHRCTSIAAYLYAAGVDKRESSEALTGAGFDEGEINISLATLYTVVQTNVVDRLRALHLVLEAEEER